MTATAAVVLAPVLSVTITRAEGFFDELKTIAFFGSYALGEARAELRRWALTAPEQGSGYDKCDFEVRWANGRCYRGRYDLQRHSSGSLAEQIREGIAWALEDALRQRKHERAEQIRALLGCDLREVTVAENDLF